MEVMMTEPKDETVDESFRNQGIAVNRHNKAADRLRRTLDNEYLFGHVPEVRAARLADLDAALLAERLRVVEQIRERLHDEAGPVTDSEGGRGHRLASRSAIDAVLDAVAER